MTELLGLCSKVCCYWIDQVESSHNKAKGVRSQNLTIEHYKTFYYLGRYYMVVEQCLDQKHTK